MDAGRFSRRARAQHSHRAEMEVSIRCKESGRIVERLVKGKQKRKMIKMSMKISEFRCKTAGVFCVAEIQIGIKVGMTLRGISEKIRVSRVAFFLFI